MRTRIKSRQRIVRMRLNEQGRDHLIVLVTPNGQACGSVAGAGGDFKARAVS